MDISTVKEQEAERRHAEENLAISAAKAGSETAEQIPGRIVFPAEEELNVRASFNDMQGQQGEPEPDQNTLRRIAGGEETLTVISQEYDVPIRSTMRDALLRFPVSPVR